MRSEAETRCLEEEGGILPEGFRGGGTLHHPDSRPLASQ